jgi:hypothetical protein
MENVYFIVDDAMQNRNREGFGVMFGNPLTAVGTFQDEFITLREARAYAKKRAGGAPIYRVFLARRHGVHKVVELREMVVFENGIDHRARKPKLPEVAKFHMGNGEYRYIVIGTQYGFLHTTAGDVRTWKTVRGAEHAIERYAPL